MRVLTSLAASRVSGHLLSLLNVAVAIFATSVQATGPGPITAITSTLLVDEPPTVSITAPASNAILPAGNITVTASGLDPDGTLSRIDFYAGTTLIGTKTSAPYSITWSNVVSGAYSLTAKATDDDGNTTVSSAVGVTVNVWPTVSITAPATNSMFAPPATVNLTAAASDADGTISKVEFYRGTTLISFDTTAPYQATDSGVTSGSYVYTAKAYDNTNSVTTSTAITVIVDALPTVAITAPSNNAVLTAPATVNLAATASDSDGTITKVEFYRGTTLIATDTSFPYQASDPGLAVGAYVYTAKAHDNLGGVTTSAPVNVTVATPTQAYFVHVDHLNTPRLIANSSGQTVWRWDQQEPFGVSPPDKNPSGLGVFEFSLRHPGQYDDPETGLFYNYFRDYDPGIGAYKQSDPIGLSGGIHTYAYVGGDPIGAIDPLGLEWVYSQSTGGLSYVSPSGGPSQHVGTGYSGTGPGRDNPAMQGTQNVGPIPQGTYDIGAMRDSRRTGREVMDLTPQPGTNTYGRSDFQIHGNNRRNDASQGCIVLPRNVRRQIDRSGDRVIRVIP